MLSETENQVRELIESKLTGTSKEEALLYHYSVERKLRAVELFFMNVKTATPVIFRSATSTSSEVQPDPVYYEQTINNISANIDAFFMSSKSTLDTFAHELRNLYGFSGHSGDLYFENALDLLQRHNSNSELNSYLSSYNVRNQSWYQDLNSYRKASAHESIIPIRPSIDVDILAGELRCKAPILKLPLDPAQKPPRFNGKDFETTGNLIKESLQHLITGSYDKIILDINLNKTTILP